LLNVTLREIISRSPRLSALAGRARGVVSLGGDEAEDFALYVSRSSLLFFLFGRSYLSEDPCTVMEEESFAILSPPRCSDCIPLRACNRKSIALFFPPSTQSFSGKVSGLAATVRTWRPSFSLLLITEVGKSSPYRGYAGSAPSSSPYVVASAGGLRFRAVGPFFLHGNLRRLIGISSPPAMTAPDSHGGDYRVF